MTKIFYHLNNDAQFDTVAKIGDIVHQLGSRDNLEAVGTAMPHVLSRFMHESYVNALWLGTPKRLAESSGLRWSSAYRASIFGMAQALLNATTYALDTGSDAFALTAGAHHARPDGGAGFCAINSLAIAALHVARTTDRNVFILDVDSHAGGGTNAFIQREANDRIHHLDVVVSKFDTYVSRRPQDKLVYIEEFIDDAYNNADAYYAALHTVLDHAVRVGAPKPGDILFVNAGVDVHEDSDIGALWDFGTGSIVTREQTIREWAKDHGLIIVGLLAGGYSGEHWSPEDLADTHVQSIDALMGFSSSSH